MKYTKSAAAVALAGIAATPMAQAATTVTLSGQVAIGIIASDADDTPGNGIVAGETQIPDPTSATGFRDATVADVVSAASPGEPTIFGDDATINVKAETTFGNGLTAIGNYRTDLGLVGDPASGDNIYVGIKGGFGEFRIGEVPDAVGRGQINDILGGSDIDGENEGISYTGSFGGFGVGVNWSPEGNSNRTSFGVSFDIGGFGVGVGVSDDDGRDEVAAKASFAISGFDVAVSYKDLDLGREVVGAEFGYGIGDWAFNIGFETEAGDVNDGDSVVRFNAGYDIVSGFNLSGRVNVNTSDTPANEVTDFRLLLTKTF